MKSKGKQCNVAKEAAKEGVLASTVYKQLAGRCSCAQVAQEVQLLTPVEEFTMAGNILKQAGHADAPKPAAIVEMAKEIMQKQPGWPQHAEPKMGKNWAGQYIKCWDKMLSGYSTSNQDDVCTQALNPCNISKYIQVRRYLQNVWNNQPQHKHAANKSPVMQGKFHQTHVIGPKGKKCQKKAQDGNQSSLTLMITICANGTLLMPPFIIFPRKKLWQSYCEVNSTDA
jgi:hypothetical protein